MKSIFWKNVKFLELNQLLNFKHLAVKYSKNMPVKNTMSRADSNPAHTEVYQSLNLTP